MVQVLIFWPGPWLCASINCLSPPQKSCLDQVWLARDGWNHETYWAGSIGLENLKERTIGRWPAGNRRWSSKYMGSQLHWAEDHAVHRSLALWHSGSQIPWNLTLSPHFEWVSLSGNQTTLPINISLVFLSWYYRTRSFCPDLRAEDGSGRSPPVLTPTCGPGFPIRDVSRSHGFLEERWTLPENIQKQPSEKLSE